MYSRFSSKAVLILSVCTRTPFDMFLCAMPIGKPYLITFSPDLISHKTTFWPVKVSTATLSEADICAVFDSSEILMVNTSLLVRDGDKAFFDRLDGDHAAVEYALLVQYVYEHIDNSAKESYFAELDYSFFHILFLSSGKGIFYCCRDILQCKAKLDIC